MSDRKLELKIGLFVFIGLIILVSFVLLIGDFKTWNLGYDITIRFNFVNGIKIGAPVRFAGVDVGEVRDIKVSTDLKNQKTDINVLAWVSKDVNIPVDSTIWVNTLGLLGEKYIEIMPGVNYASVVRPNDMIVGLDPIPMHEVMRTAKEIADNVEDGINRIKNKEGTLGKLLYDDGLYYEIEALISEIRKNPWKLFWKTKEKPEPSSKPLKDDKRDKAVSNPITGR